MGLARPVLSNGIFHIGNFRVSFAFRELAHSYPVKHIVLGYEVR
jgi:hypothetical protein